MTGFCDTSFATVRIGNSPSPTCKRRQNKREGPYVKGGQIKARGLCVKKVVAGLMCKKKVSGMSHE